MKSKFLPFLVFFLLVLLPHTLWGKVAKPPWDGAIKLIDPKNRSTKKKNRFLTQNLERVILAIEKLSLCFPDKEAKEKLKKIAREFQIALKEGRILYQPKAEWMGKKRAFTKGKGTDPRKKKVLLSKQVLFMGSSTCSDGFISLLIVVLHEGYHLLEKLTPFPNMAGEKEILKWKIVRLSLEARAYFFSRKILARIHNWLTKMSENRIRGFSPMKGLPPCMEIWKKCSSIDITFLLERCSIERKGIAIILRNVLTKKYHGKNFTPKKLEEIVKRLRRELLAWKKLRVIKGKITNNRIYQEIQRNAKIGWYHFQRKRPFLPGERRLARVKSEKPGRKKPPVEVDLSFGIDSSRATVGDMKVPEIRFPQDAVILRDKAGEPWLWVVGFNHLSMGSGTVVAIPADPKAIQTTKYGLKIRRRLTTFAFLPKKRRVILKNSIFLPHPTSFLMLPRRRLHIWDPVKGGVFELVDTSGDGVADFLAKENKLPLSKAWKKKVENMAEAEWTGTSIRIYLRALLSLHTYEGPVFYAQDLNGDGIFENKAIFTPSTVPDNSPVILGSPVAGSDFIHVFGVPEHRIVILSRVQGSPVEYETFKGRGRISKNAMGIIRLKEPVLPFEIYRAIDLSNGSSSGFYPTSKKIASISELSSSRISSRDFQELVVFGYELWTVKEAWLGGVNTPFYREGHTLHLLIFPRKRKEKYELRLFLLDGTSITPNYTLSGGPRN